MTLKGTLSNSIHRIISKMARLKRSLLRYFLPLTLLISVLIVYPPFPKNTKMEVVGNFSNDSSSVMNCIRDAVSRSHLNTSHCFSSNLSKTQYENLLTEILESERRRTSRPTTHRQSKQTSVILMPKESPDFATKPNVNIAASPTTAMIPESKVQFLRKTNLAYDDIPQLRISDVNCAKLIKGDKTEQERATIYQKEHPKTIVPDQKIYSEALNCSKFLSDRRYIRKPGSEEENNFPLAFSILLFKDVEQFERLLRAIYRPQNFYCIHVDKKSPKPVQDAVGAIVSCLENVLMAPEQFDVKWGTFSILEPELSCMRKLLKYKKWKYFINLTGQEFPLKTNWQIVEILKIFNGANNLEGTVKRFNRERIANIPPAPFQMRVTKGSVHIVATRGYVEYVIYNETSIKFCDWVKQTYVPDETYFSTLNFNPHLQVPGSYLGVPETDIKKNLFIVRFKNWGRGLFNWPCGGKHANGICIFSVRDLPLLASRLELFANKFHIDYEPLALDCLEELHYNRTKKEIHSGPEINRTFYEELDFVRNHL